VLGASIKPWIKAQRWGLGVTLVMLVSSLWLYACTPISWTPGSDGFYSWIYARSLAFDGDIDFKNDYALCGDPFRIGVDRGTGHPDNIFYSGPALVWTPLLVVLRLVLRGLPPAASCGPPFSTIVLGFSPLLGALTAWLCYRLARRHFSDGVAALAVALLVLAGPALKIATCLPSYSHTCDALFVSALLVLTARAAERPLQRLRWAWVALALTACIVQRLSNVTFAAVPLVAAAATLSSRRRESLIVAATIGAGMLAGLGACGAIYRYLYGSPFVFTHGPYFVHLAHAHPFLLLFDEVQGVFFCTPALWLSVLGLVPALRDRPLRRLLLPLCAIAFIEVYLSSAALDWAPSRRLTNLSPLGVLLACYPLRSLAAWSRLRPRGLATAGLLLASPFCVASLGYAWGAPRGLVPGSTRFFSVLNETLGRMAALPAEIVFSLRYHLPRDRFGEAITPSWYTRDFRSLAWIRRDLVFTNPRLARLMAGFSGSTGGAKLIGPRAHLVFATQWPFATHAIVRAAGPTGARLRLGESRVLGEPRWFGESKSLPATSGVIEFAIPPGEFSSGIHDLVFEVSGDDLRETLIVSLSLDDRTQRPPAFQR